VILSSDSSFVLPTTSFSSPGKVCCLFIINLSGPR
jgi:hypothetical protein